MSSQKRRHPLLWLAGLLFLGLSANVSAGDAEAPQPLPGDILFYASSDSLDQAFAAVDAFVQECIKGAPFAPMIPAGKLKTEFLKGAAFPMEIVDNARPIQIIVSNPKFLGAEPPVVFVLPINGFAEKIADLTEKGYTVSEHEDGVYTIKKGWRVNVNVLPIEGNFVLAIDKRLDNKSGAIKYFSKLLQTEAGKALINRPISTAVGAPIFSMQFDVKKLLKINEAGVNALVGIGKLGLDNEIKKDETPPIILKFMKLGSKYIDHFVAFLNMIDQVGVQGFAEKGQIRYQFSLTPIAGSKLAEIANAYQKDKAPHRLVGFLPKGAAITQSVHIHPKALAVSSPFINEVIADLTSAMFDDAVNTAVQDSMKKMLAIFGNDASVAIFSREANPGQSQVQYFRVKDGQAYQQALATSMKQMKPMMKQLVAATHAAGGPENNVDIDIKYEENAGEIEGVKYSKISMSVTFKDDMPGMGKQQQELLKTMMEQSTSLIAIQGDVVIVCAGSNREAELAAAIKALRTKTQRVAADPLFTKLLVDTPNKQITFATINPVALMRLYAHQMSGMIPQMGAAIGKAMKGITDGTSHWVITMGTEAGTTAAAPARFVGAMTVPAKSVQELITKGQQFKMRMMQEMMKNRGGDAPVEEIPEEPLEEF